MTAARRRLRTLLGSALGLILLAPLLTIAPASAHPVSSDPPAPSIPHRYLKQKITWTTCPFDADNKKEYSQAPTTSCAVVKAPMDWNNPRGHRDIDVAIAYTKATGRSKGLLISNPGGPGLSGRSFTSALAVHKPQLFSDFDLVGVDPRGFASSTNLACRTTLEQLQALPVTPDRRDRSALTHARELAEAKLLAEACSATEFGQFVSTQQTVFDLELVRALLGSPKLNFIGYSYGSWLAGWYADTYPSKVGRFVLDSTMDLTASHWQNMNLDPLSAQRRRDTQLFPWMARNSDLIDEHGLGDRPSEVLASYESIRAGLVELFVARRSRERGDRLDEMTYVNSYNNVRFVRAALDILVMDEFVHDPSADGDVDLRHVDKAWARIDPKLQAYDSIEEMRARYGVPEKTPVPADAADSADLRVRNTSTLLGDALARAESDAAGADEVVELDPVPITVRCNDSKWRKDPSYYIEQTDRNAARYPFFGYINGLPMCAFWPYEPQTRTIDLRPSPQVLMVQAELDPATAWEGAARTHRILSDSTRLVSIDDDGEHAQYVGSPSPCAEAIADKFVFDGVLPRRNQVCATTPLPAESKVFEVDGPLDGKVVPWPNRGHRERPNRLLQKALDEVAINQM